MTATVCECGGHVFRPFVFGSVLIADVEDRELLASPLTYSRAGMKVYAKTYVYPLKGERLHRKLAKADASDWVDHANRNTCDNRKSNLRRCSPSQNAANRAPKPKTTSGLKGVFKTSSGRFEAGIFIDGRRRYLGSFPTAEEAQAAYIAAAQQHFGEFARWGNE